MSTEALLKYLPLIVPVVILQLVLMIICLVDLIKRERTNGPKWMWALIILLGELLGPILYLILGRKE